MIFRVSFIVCSSLKTMIENLLKHFSKILLVLNSVFYILKQQFHYEQTTLTSGIHVFYDYSMLEIIAHDKCETRPRKPHTLK